MSKQELKEEILEVLNPEQLEQITELISDISTDATEASKKTINKGLEIAKEYPLHTAIGAGALGFIAGLISNKLMK